MLGTLKNGEQVWNRPRSHLHSSSELAKYLPEALKQIDPDGKKIDSYTVDFGKIIGRSNCIPTAVDDEIVYARRPGRAGVTRFVQGKEPLPTSKLTIVLLKGDTGYVAISAFMGPQAAPESWDKHATEESKLFWNSHALVWGSEPIEPGTEIRPKS